MKEKDMFVSRLIEITQSYKIPDCRIIYGHIGDKDYSVYKYQESDVIIHTSFAYEHIEWANGRKAKVLRDYGDPLQLLAYRKEITELCESFGYDSFKVYYDGFRSFSLDYPEVENNFC